MVDFHSESEWMESKLKHDMVILNNFIRPLPQFSPQQNSDKKRKALKEINQIREKDSFNRLSLKMLGLSNMINLMTACQYTQMSSVQMDPHQQMFGGHCFKTMENDTAI